MTHEIEQQIGRDLELIDLVHAIGRPSAKRKATIQRKKIMAYIHAENEKEGLTDISDDELLRELEGSNA